MARKTVLDVMRMIASTVNQEASAPASGSDEFNLWLQYLNRSQEEWSEAYDWESSRRHYWPSITGSATVSLPIHFDKLAAPVKIYTAGKDTPDLYSYVIDENESMYSTLDKYVKVTGDLSTGKSLVFNPATLSSGASVLIQFFATPTTLSGASQYMAMEDPQYAVDRSIAYIFEARSDPRFQIEETKARERLLTMVENANDAKFSSYAATSYVPSTLARQGFRVGRD